MQKGRHYRLRSRTFIRRWQHIAAGFMLATLLICTALTSHALLLHSYASLRAMPSVTSASGQDYLYYVLKNSSGFVLARARKGLNAQPVETPRQVASFGGGFGQTTTDGIITMQLSPDGHYLAIDGTRSDGELVWVFDTRGQTLRLEPVHVGGTFLRWLPDPNTAFLYRPMFPLGLDALAGQANWNPGLWLVNAATGAHTEINLHLPSAFLVDATVAPNGKQIIYSTSAGLGAGSEIWTVDNDGRNQARLLSLPASAQSIAGQFTWSPNGQTIAYERLADSPTPFLAAGLWLMNSHGGTQRYLAQVDGGHGFALNWSPNGKKIAFVARTNLDESQADQRVQSLQSAVEVVDVNSGHVQRIAGLTQTGMQINAIPVWSSNSSQIAFAAFNPLNPDVGGSLRYWTARVDAGSIQPSVAPLSPPLTHIIALSQGPVL